MTVLINGSDNIITALMAVHIETHMHGPNDLKHGINTKLTRADIIVTFSNSSGNPARCSTVNTACDWFKSDLWCLSQCNEKTNKNSCDDGNHLPNTLLNLSDVGYVSTAR